MADFSTKIWKPKDNGVIFPRARILYPARTVLEKDKIKSFAEKQKWNIPRQTYNEWNPLGERNDSIWKLLDARKKENQWKKGHVWGKSTQILYKTVA